MSKTSEGTRSQRRGFTIVELVVAIGVLSILLAMAGSIFTLTLKSSGDATALIEVKERLAALEQSLREDLRFVSPDNSLMVIQGNPVNAFWTADEQEADADGDPYTGVPVNRDPQREFVDMSSGSPVLRRERPRADILMFFTNRPGKSYVNPEITGRLQQVVYGQAELREMTPTSLNWPLPPAVSFANARPPQANLLFTPGSPFGTYSAVSVASSFMLFPQPARQWVLARRSVVIVDGDLTGLDPAADLDDSDETGNDSLSVSGVSLARKNFIRDGRRDYLQNGYDFNGDGSPDFDYELDVVQRPADPAFDNDPSNPNATINWIARSQLDPTPPPAFASRLGHYFMPNCASFKVEWALELDNPGACGEIIWVDPGDMAGTLQRIYARAARACNEVPVDDACSLALVGEFCNNLPPPPPPAPQILSALHKLLPKDPTLNSNDTPDALPIRFCDFGFPSTTTGTPRATHVFYTSEPDSLSSAMTADPLFPKALRITVDVYDSAGRLDRPVRHVMVLPVGSD